MSVGTKEARASATPAPLSISPRWVARCRARDSACLGRALLLSRIGILALLFLVTGGASAREWPENIFHTKPSVGRSFAAVHNVEPRRAQTVIGRMSFFRIQSKDTLLDVARYYDLGYNEIIDANPGVDAWIPKPGGSVLLPTAWIIPDGDHRGLVVNIPEMRLYYFRPTGPDVVTVTTYPVGLGRDEWRTPRAKFRIRGKTVNPSWIPPASIRAEHRRDGRPLPGVIPGGAPDNPLGKYRLELTLPLYGIHGTNIPWGVGMQVSHGCVRLYPEDIERLFPMVAVGTPGEFTYQPVKVGLRDSHIFVEVHQDIYGLIPGLYREALRLIEKFGAQACVDWSRVKRAVLSQSGVPTDVGTYAQDGLCDEFLPSTRQPRRTGPGAHPAPRSP